MELEHINVLGDILNMTWGRASTPGGAATCSVTAKQQGDNLRILYLAAVNIGTVQEMNQARELNGDQARKSVDEFIKNVKKLFKQETKKALKVKQLTEDDSFEIVGNAPYGSLRRGYYRLSALFELSA